MRKLLNDPVTNVTCLFPDAHPITAARLASHGIALMERHLGNSPHRIATRRS